LLLTGKLAFLQQQFAEELGTRVYLVSITTDPLTDTPEVLKAYAERFRANPAGWRFLTGTLDEVVDVLRRYRLLAADTLEGFDPPVVTYVVDAQGAIAATYVGTGFELRALADTIRARLSSAPLQTGDRRSVSSGKAPGWRSSAQGCGGTLCP
jgi:cytochrome oxidase Cu insertion factor (SCO1/SenC/PrrC family)